MIETQIPCLSPPSQPEIRASYLALEDIHHGYREGDAARLPVLRGANIVLYPGEMVGLVAPSGAGKSTCLHIAGLLERPDSGQVYISGRPCADLKDAQRSRVRRLELGVVYQFHHLLPEFTALENVMIPQLLRGLNRKEATARAQALLAYMQLEARAHHRPNALSGGERQRVAIARAVANAPRVLLADEPTGNLDSKTSQHVFNALSVLVRQSGLTALIVTHNLDLAKQMDRCLTLFDGKIFPINEDDLKNP